MSSKLSKILKPKPFKLEPTVKKYFIAIAFLTALSQQVTATDYTKVISHLSCWNAQTGHSNILNFMGINSKGEHLYESLLELPIGGRVDQTDLPLSYDKQNNQYQVSLNENKLFKFSIDKHADRDSTKGAVAEILINNEVNKYENCYLECAVIDSLQNFQKLETCASKPVLRALEVDLTSFGAGFDKKAEDQFYQISGELLSRRILKQFRFLWSGDEGGRLYCLEVEKDNRIEEMYQALSQIKPDGTTSYKLTPLLACPKE